MNNPLLNYVPESKVLIIEASSVKKTLVKWFKNHRDEILRTYNDINESIKFTPKKNALMIALNEVVLQEISKGEPIPFDTHNVSAEVDKYGFRCSFAFKIYSHYYFIEFGLA